jgi:predicted PurR-regulated permease PerM
MNEFSGARALYRGALFTLALVALGLIALELKWVLLQLFAAIIVAAGMAPVVRRARDPSRSHIFGRRLPTAAVVLLIYLALAVILLVVGSILVGAALDGTNTLIARAPQYAAEINAWLQYLQQSSPLLANLDVIDLFGGVSGLTQSAAGFLTQMLGAASVVLGIFGGVLNVLFILFMALYITVDGESMRDYAMVFLPLNQQPRAQRLATNISNRLSHWVVGQLLLAFIIGTVAGIGLGLLGVPGAPVLGLVWMVAEFIPGIGPFISAVPSIALGFLASPTTGLLAAVFSLAWSQIENNIITPRLMGRAVALNPLVVLLALLAGNELLGLVGALLAIPAAAALGVVVDELRGERLEALAAQTAALQAQSPAHPLDNAQEPGAVQRTAT